MLSKRGEIAHSHLFHYVFTISLNSGVKFHIHLWNVVVWLFFSSILQIWYVEVRISRRISDSPLRLWDYKSQLYHICPTGTDSPKQTVQTQMRCHRMVSDYSICPYLHLKMSSVCIFCWIFLQTFQTYFCIQANSVDPDQTAPRAVCSHSVCKTDLKSQADDKADDNCCDWHFKGSTKYQKKYS